MALDADTGAYAWHYQTTPGEAWDYNSAMDMTLADLVIDGRTRKVLLHAPKNGFFYVIDRADGRLLSAEKFAKVTWAERVDLATGRPVVAANALYEQGEVQLFPSFEGAHNWFPMSFSPRTGLVYLPVTEMGASYSQKGIDPANWKPIPHSVQFAGIASGDGDPPADSARSSLTAWDPGPRAPGLDDRDAGCAQQRHARDCRRPRVPGTGRWPHPCLCGTATADVSGPSTREPPCSVRRSPSAWTGASTSPCCPARCTARSADSVPCRRSSAGMRASIRGGCWRSRSMRKASLPPTPPPRRVEPLDAPGFAVDPAKVQAGLAQYSRCLLCHGPGAVAGGTAPDLRASALVLSREAFATVVRNGSLESRGMPTFAELTDDELDALRHYIRYRAEVASGK